MPEGDESRNPGRAQTTKNMLKKGPVNDGQRNKTTCGQQEREKERNQIGCYLRVKYSTEWSVTEEVSECHHSLSPFTATIPLAPFPIPHLAFVDIGG